jgi:hypothetical protein
MSSRTAEARFKFIQPTIALQKNQVQNSLKYNLCYSTHRKTHRPAASPLQKRLSPNVIERAKGGVNSKLHAKCDGAGKPAALLLSARQVSDYNGAKLLLKSLPPARKCWRQGL